MLHDADRESPNALLVDLVRLLGRSPIGQHAIIIPVQEIEAWLLSDSNAIKAAMNLKTNVPRIADPESDDDAKGTLAKLIYRHSGKTKTYINTQHNGRIASRVTLEQLRRCRSFRPLESFLLSVL